MTASLTRAERIAALHQAAKERILVLDGSWGVMIQRRGLDEADFRADRFVAAKGYDIMADEAEYGGLGEPSGLDRAFLDAEGAEDGDLGAPPHHGAVERHLQRLVAGLAFAERVAEVDLAVDVMLPADRLGRVLRAFAAEFPTVQLRLHVEALGAITAMILDRKAIVGISGPLAAGVDGVVDAVGFEAYGALGSRRGCVVRFNRCPSVRRFGGYGKTRS